MNAKDRAVFVSSYTKVLTTAWSDEAYMAALLSDPIEALARQGLMIPKGSSVQIITEATGEPSLETQVSLWEIGRVTGEFKLFVPPVPEAADFELDDDLLDEIDGGAACCSCCCCPCCSCT